MQPNTYTNGISTLQSAPLDPLTRKVRAQLERLLATRFFRTSPRLRRFLEFTVEQALSGYEGRLKEYCIALEVFGKPDYFDPRVDSAVRVAARQLRGKLDAYYLGEGMYDEVLIRFRPGDYVPRFYQRSSDSLRHSIKEGEVKQEHTRVVIVEKERSTVTAIVEALDTLNFSVSAILDNAEGVDEAVRRAGGAVVITGLVLSGGLNGLELTKHLHEASGPPVIFLASPSMSHEVLQEIALSEPDAILFKPVRPADVGAAIRLAVAKSGQLFDGLAHPVAESAALVAH
jgi:CheY-like chemotaxis protein